MNVVELFVTFGQLSVFNSQLNDPFNDWDEVHVSQGFAWRPGAVSFRTLLDGDHRVEMVMRDRESEIVSGARRVVEVPFDVAGEIEVASISDGCSVDLERGLYQLRVEFCGEVSGKQQVHLTFTKCARPRFAVPVVDRELSMQHPLATMARPAI
ncbi:competence protein ComJ [Ensifer sp. 2YAB10]|uniref:competence protein ComJ n=1 Tax=unclassified Ensifer TaxID=2633371 RepID=UPI003F93A7D1